jgi:hypothetical protein
MNGMSAWGEPKMVRPRGSRRRRLSQNVISGNSATLNQSAPLRSLSRGDHASIRDAVKSTDLVTLVGPINFTGQPHPNVCRTPVLGGQMGQGREWPFDLKIVDNTASKIIQPEAKLKPIAWT